MVEPSELLPSPVHEGLEVRGHGITVGEFHVYTFAGLIGDYFPLHTDAVFAANSSYEGRVAHGLLTMSIAIGSLTPKTAAWGVQVALGFDGIRFHQPVYFGDTITPVGTIRTLTTTSSGKRIATVDVDVLNQDSVKVCSVEMTLMLAQPF